MKKLLALLAVVFTTCGATACVPARDLEIQREQALTSNRPDQLSVTESSESPVIAQDEVGTSSTFEAMLRELPIKGRAPKTGYYRDYFGQRWSDDVTVEGGHNGCDTRNDILRRDLINPVIRPGTHGCVVESGTLQDPYTGTTVNFVRGDRQVEIDHVVPLADAWVKGGQSFDPDTARNFANDPRNLLAVTTSPNRRKGAGDAATWLPKNKAFRCQYAQKIIVVKHIYGLWVTQAEHDALARELGRCV